MSTSFGHGPFEGEKRLQNIFRLQTATKTPASCPALGNVAKARGIAEVEKASGLCRESLYKVQASGAKSRFETRANIMRTLNLGFSESRLPVRAKKSRKLRAARVASEVANATHFISSNSFRASPNTS